MSDRRDFLRTTGAAAAAIALASAPRRASAAPAYEDLDRFQSGASKELLLEAINAAKMGGASYADCRIARFRQNFVVTREQQIINVVDTDTLGCGVRALVDGCWGFAATRDLTRAAV
ncbi:MAG: twin-arginine translocation signal domain-containing protein, partial [Gemmatimonadetes bacterium]|nr:twin-arginine translocation signal domain-containing protein [Gemmatimonadota bacterium]